MKHHQNMPDTTRNVTRASSRVESPAKRLKLQIGTGLNEAERRENGLEGLLPTRIESLETQMNRVFGHLSAKPNDLERYIYLQELAIHHRTLFYSTVMSDPKRFLPIIYDPVIAQACTTYGHLYREPQGMYLNKNMKGRIAEVLRNWPECDAVRFICITSGGRILGLGDIGANGAPLAVGKLQLYTACAGVPPEVLLPIHLDIGTSNAALRADPLYTGLREEPISTAETNALMDEFMEAAKSVFPGVCIHFEDWKGDDAIRLLDRYRDQYLVYNDDIQGTASVTLAGILTALKEKKQKLADQRFLFAGAGSAGIGIAKLLVEAMVKQGSSAAKARERISLFDVHGLIQKKRKDLNAEQKMFAHDAPAAEDLKSAVDQAKPTVLVGVSTVGGLFDRTVIEAMMKNCERPIIFPLSNPTENAEAVPKDLYAWTKGQALVACGVQFDDVNIDSHTFHPGQANNFYVFPAIGLAVYATKPKLIDNAMFIAAAHGISDQLGPGDRERGMLYPIQEDILEVEITTAARVAEHIFDHDQATVARPADIRQWLESMVYRPSYGETGI